MTQHAPPIFYVGLQPPAGAALPCFVLAPDKWDDYSFRTQFRLYVFRHNAQPLLIGQVKILLRGLAAEDEGGLRQTQTSLPRSFASLSTKHFCSVGQTSQYYTEIHRISEHLGYAVKPELVVEALADLCFATAGDRWWENEAGFMTSLLRFPAANIARQQASALVRGLIPEAHNHNSLLVADVAMGSVKPGGYELLFDGTLEIPGRLNVIVGRNGSGKTTLLERMALQLSGDVSRTRERKPPKFSRIAFVSNNVFDQGYAPRWGAGVRFIGPRPGDAARITNVLVQARIADEQNWPSVREQLFPDPESVMKMLPEIDDHLKEDLSQLQVVLGWREFAARVFEDEELGQTLASRPAEAISVMSAGQKALAGILAGLYKDLDQQSLVLLDEPENYLHPSLIARFIRDLNLLLHERKAFAVLATHSPIIVQETPSRFVTIIERAGTTIELTRPPFETFGESVENIDEYLFETDFSSSHWKKVLSEFAERGLTDDQIRGKLQSSELPLLAQAYLERQRLKRGRN